MTTVAVEAGPPVSLKKKPAFQHQAEDPHTKALAIVLLHETIRIAGHIYQAALNYTRSENHNVERGCSTANASHKAGYLTRLSFHAEHVLQISLFAAFPPKSRLLDIAFITPLPHATELLLQAGALLLVEETFRSWAYRVPVSWMTKPGSTYRSDRASQLAIEYMIPKAALSLVMLAIGVSQAVGARLQTLHLAAVVVWSALRQFRILKKGWNWNFEKLEDGEPAPVC